MRLGVLLLPDARWAVNAQRWRSVEELGFDSAWTYDHIWWRGLRDSAWFSAMPVLAAASAVTSKMHIGLMVGSPNFRHPVTLAKESIAIDDISGGRFILGIGAGAPHAGDAEVLGGPPLTPEQRARRFHEFVRLTDKLLGAPVTSYRGSFYAAEEARMIPGSTRHPRLPLAIAASGVRGITLAASYADGWISPGPADWLGGSTPDECLATVTAQARQFKEACERAGRDYEGLERIFIATPMAGDPLRSAKSCLELAERCADAGMTHLVIHWPRESGIYAGDPRVLEEIAADALSEIGRL